MDDQELRDKVIMKTQFKRDTYKILGPVPSDYALDEPSYFTKENDVNIYNDHDFYTMMLSDFLAINDNEQHNESGDKDENGEFLFGADLSLTQKYLAKR